MGAALAEEAALLECDAVETDDDYVGGLLTRPIREKQFKELTAGDDGEEGEEGADGKETVAPA